MLRSVCGWLAAEDCVPLGEDGFTESGDSQTRLRVKSNNTNSFVSSVGVRVYRHFVMDEGESEIVPELRLRWAHEYGDVDRKVNASFAAASNPRPFQVKGAEAGRDVAVLGLGWTVIGADGLSLSLNYDANLNSDYTAHALTAGLLVQF